MPHKPNGKRLTPRTALLNLKSILPSLLLAGRRPRPKGKYAGLRIAVVADELTRSCLRQECQVLDVTPSNSHRLLRASSPDLLFVESAWHGHNQAWKYRIAAYQEHPERDNADLRHLVAQARDLGIPTVFWNKEDAVHFDRFVSSALLFDYIFTVDASCIPRYRALTATGVPVHVLPFAVQPTLHSFTGIDASRRGANFVGSYSRHIHGTRRERQDMLITTAAATLGLTVYDRNSGRRSDHYRYPQLPGLQVRSKVGHARTGAIYKGNLVSLNVNTVEDSETMFSRRLIEIIACGGLAVTTPALSVDRMFRDYCHVVASADEALALFERLKRDGYSAHDREMIAAGARYVAGHHTYTQRLDTVLDVIGHGRR